MEKSLLEPAINRWKIIINDVRDLATFERKFLKRYWGERAQ